ncbi:MAG: DUF1998 domain-containing protein, partial [Victivallaceae bacterium]|nr:DUF1998 domain-containing protein [Victivallaceae bacterium]
TIYLQNPVFRARHLRAEALHQFLTWLYDHNNFKASTTWPSEDNVVTIWRKWAQVGHFFLGRQCNPSTQKITAIFPPIVEELSNWAVINGKKVQSYITEIKDVGELDYQVADDLVWQLHTQADKCPYTLDDNNNLSRYSDLAGPNQPENKDGNLTISSDVFRREVAYRVEKMYNNSGQDKNNRLSPEQASRIQIHLLYESTITWLTRNRVLPKYGFPVDVIRLLSADNDPYGQNVELERDRRIGLYEYAPGQAVMADKRIYQSAQPLVFLPHGIKDTNATRKNFFLCRSCHQPHEENDTGVCVACGGQIDPSEWLAIQPDAFQAAPSRAGNAGVRPEGGTPLKIFSGGIKKPISLNNSSLFTAESITGELLYVNFGPGYQGFSQNDGQRFALYHTVKTDIAVWGPAPILFAPGGSLYELEQESRLGAALRSALEAILSATALELGIADNEISGLTYPYDRGKIGFVLFDEASGGGGAMRQLVLTGNPDIDIERVVLIRSILDRARKLCTECQECNKNLSFAKLDLDLRPVDRNTILSHPERNDIRERQSCYKCLRTYANQRFHHLLDRGDAVVILDALRSPTP